MSRDTESDGGIDRRQFLNWASTVGLISIAPETISEVANGKTSKSPPETTPPEGDVHHTHVTEIPSIQRQVGRFDEEGDPTVLFNPTLTEHLQKNPKKQEFKLIVRTIGERSITKMNGPGDRTIHGWAPRASELDELSEYGELGFVPEFISTTVTLHDVKREDISKIASLPFVVEVNWDPPVSLDNATVDELRGSNYFRFKSIETEVSIPSWLRIGIIDTGYQGNGSSKYTKSYAENIGIDKNLAKDLTTESDWRNTYNDHGDNVADTCAYMLQKGHDDLFVPLKVYSADSYPYTSDVRDNTRNAIEYAEKNSINIINMSLGTDGPKDTCPSTFCPELDSYRLAGFFPFATTGNKGKTGSVNFPGGEWLTVGVGGMHGSCSSGGDYERHQDSNYGTIVFYNSSTDTTYCHYCNNAAGNYTYAEFSPKVYGCHKFDTDSGDTLNGTSFACPQATAAGAIMQSNGSDVYDNAESIFREMNLYTICPDEASYEGELLNAEYAYNQTN